MSVARHNITFIKSTDARKGYRARVLVLFHYVFHNTTCSVPPVGLHKSTDDGLTTTTPSLTSQSLFYVSTMAVLPR
jgi:hypothetical protein